MVELLVVDPARFVEPQELDQKIYRLRPQAKEYKVDDENDIDELPS